jgi:hypothetical protein
LAQPQLQKWARCSTAVLPKMFTFREKLSQVPPVLEDFTMSRPLPENGLVLLLYIINALEVEGLLCLPQSMQPTWPQLYACFVLCCLFCTSRHPQLGF